MKRIILSVLVCMVSSLVFANSFNSKLSAQEISDAKAGKTIIRNIGSYQKMCFESDNPQIKEYFEFMKELNPKYFAEVIIMRKFDESSDQVGTVTKVLSDINSYTEIPFYDKDKKVTESLYTYSHIDSESTSGSTTKYNIKLTLPPFKKYAAQIDVTKEDNLMIYKSVNVEDMTSNGFMNVKKDKLGSFIVSFIDDGYLVIYGIGTIDAPKMGILTKSVEEFYFSRVEAFCNYATTFLK